MSTVLPPAAGGPAGPTDPAIDTGGGTGLWKDAFIRLRRNPQAIAGAVIIGLFLLVAALAPLLAPYGGNDLPGRTSITPPPSRGRAKLMASRSGSTASAEMSSAN